MVHRIASTAFCRAPRRPAWLRHDGFPAAADTVYIYLADSGLCHRGDDSSKRRTKTLEALEALEALDDLEALEALEDLEALEALEALGCWPRCSKKQDRLQAEFA